EEFSRSNWVSCINTSFRRYGIVDCEVLLESLITETVEEIPVAPVVTHATRKTICDLIDRRLQEIRIRTCKAAKYIWRPGIIQRPGHKRRSLSRVAIVFEQEAQMLCRVEREIHRAELANGRPIMIDSQARQTARIWLIVIAIPVIVAL